MKLKGKTQKEMKLLRNRLTKVVSLRSLPDLAHYRIGKRHFRKIGNSHSIDERTGKDVIFSLGTKVKKVYEDNVNYILCPVFPFKY